MKFLKNANGSSRRLSDSNLLLVITIAIFVVMYICAVAFIGSGFTKVQTFFNILNENAALIVKTEDGIKTLNSGEVSIKL